MLALAAFGCQPRNVSFSLRFEQPGTRSSTAAVMVRIREDSCTGRALHNNVFPLSDPQSARTPPLLTQGVYAFEAEARDATCQVIARSTCIVRELPLEGDTLELSLADVTPAPACPAAACDNGACMDDEPDAGPEPVDAGTDAGTVGCSGDGDCPGGSCHGSVCCFGCWDGSSCQAGDTSGACGSEGGLCSMCSAAQTCAAGACVSGDPVSLSLSPVSTYVRGGTRLWSGGSNTGLQRGQLDSATSDVFSRQTTTVAFVDVAAAQLATCGIDTMGALSCWGTNASGLLGVGSTAFMMQVSAPQRAGTDSWRDVVAGNMHFCAIRADEHLFCWGANAEGRLGVAAGSRTAPTEIAAGGTWRAVSPGDVHTCGIRTDGTLHCWGDSRLGRLGVAGATSGPGAQQVGTATDWIAVSAGVEHTCAIRGTGGSGTLFCWGAQDFGRLGDGASMGMAETPVMIDATRQWTGIAAGQYHSCAVTREREVYCWGVGTRGATGLGEPGDANVPTLVSAGFDRVAVGWTHTCAASAGDATLAMVRCWGEGSDGRLGTGRTVDERMPAVPTFEPAP